MVPIEVRSMTENRCREDLDLIFRKRWRVDLKRASKSL
jgi:hypothetical protein